MTSYEVLISEELLDEVRRDPSRLPEGFRIGEVTAQPGARVGELPSYRSMYVQVEDDRAPAELEGQLVDPTFHAEYDEAGNWLRTVVLSRAVADRAADGYRALVADGGRPSVQPSGSGTAAYLPPYTEGRPE